MVGKDDGVDELMDVEFRRAMYGYRNGRYYCQPHLHRDDHAEHRCGLCNAMFFGGRGGASLKAHKSKAVRLGGCPGAPSLTGSGLKSEAVKKLKRKELEDLMPKVSIDPTNWEGVTEEDRAALDSAGHLELQNEYEMKYLGAKIRADADTLQADASG